MEHEISQYKIDYLYSNLENKNSLELENPSLILSSHKSFSEEIIKIEYRNIVLRLTF